MQIVPTDKRRNLTNLVPLRLAPLSLQVDELGHTTSSKHPVTPAATHLPEAEREYEPDQVCEVYVRYIASKDPLEKPSRLHDDEGYGRGVTASHGAGRGGS